ncbi:Ubiquitin-conjugating enzyme E2 [Penicillium bovifimosum]|uniref:Ubiquitin-conjugating enzyme E2 n=1 Tax=Penicillium bovifimosum TaxID=126998 RepID=A0A9W9GNH6_9EURO|nr:Ubiquitin-conjugating enzyme E2 [Penicillium bovifimosum]KAJ5124723.1 Ubiquitin-conjugating enzyme E2 [Penicillium bovifimosum]
MPRKDFLRDIAEAAVPGRFSRIVNVTAGECDGSISFTLTAPGLDRALDFQAIVTDCQDYPKYHSFLVFSSSEDCPQTVTAALENEVPMLSGSTIHTLLATIEDVITHSTTDPGLASNASDSDHPNPSEEDFDDDESMADYEPDWESDNGDTKFSSDRNLTELKEKIRRDLRVVKDAGFKVGYLGEKFDSIIVSVSCRISKLGISKEAMRAWGVEPTEYLVLLMRYHPNYLDLRTMLEVTNDSKSPLLQMHVGLCDSYKPSFRHAIEALVDPLGLKSSGEATSSDNTMCGQILKPLFIGRSLNSLLNKRLLGIIKLRLRYAFSWTAAELFFHTNQGKVFSVSDATSEEYSQRDVWATSTPALLAADHVAERDHDTSQMSLPLAAMQFTLRHFTKCTEFCLVCHCKTGDTFEALKPYVCSNELCLYQYLALDMGTSLEHEISSQPSVVNLLISLAYARAESGRLTDFPTGLRLRVPAKMLSRTDGQPADCHTGLLTEDLLLSSQCLPDSVRAGDWIVIIGAYNDRDWHCRVKQIIDSNQWRISQPVMGGHQVIIQHLQNPQFKCPTIVNFVVYDTNMDDLDSAQKQKIISTLLSELPSLDNMLMFIQSHTMVKALSSWEDMISPAGLNLLRWIVASNRSFIQRGDLEPQHQVTGMGKYIEFRLVQGAADKEQRFLNAVNSISAAQDPPPDHPTLFAWHGSPVHSWHSILREGLHFKFMTNGRAYGNGIYLSNNFATSLGYTAVLTASKLIWPENRMKISTMVSLNEIVNAPRRFVNCIPHYVVQHLDWIQPRYLFVELQTTENQNNTWANLMAAHRAVPNHQSVAVNPRSSSEDSDIVYYKQDQRFPVFGPENTPIEIPIPVFKRKKADYLRNAAQQNAAGVALPPESSSTNRKYSDEDEDTNSSIMTTADDLDILLSDSDDEIPDSPMQTESIPDNEPKTDFEPGTLSRDILPVLDPPQYATTTATKLLQQHLNATIKTQNKVPLHELGWYVDPNLITTVYQWIVELHSFDPDLPLAKDLKSINLKSIVLELRFPPQFPIDPPFFRVIRPRFLQFAAGGGGHVTVGGAMCMELLTHSGWLPTASIESVLLQVRLAITSTDPRPARLERVSMSTRKDYSVAEAVEDYRRVAIVHGWQISNDLQKLAW